MLIQYLSVSVRMVCDAPVGSVAEKKIELILRAVQALDGDAAAVVQPNHARKIDVGIRARVHPFRFAAGDRDDADAHDRIRFARLRIARVFHRAGRANSCP